MAQWWWLLLAADVMLLVAVGALLWRLRRGVGKIKGQSAPDLAGFLAEANRLSREFDRLLGEKRELVGATLSAIDQRLAALKALEQELAEKATRMAARAAEPDPPASAADQAAFRQRVLVLARQGQNAGQIAAATGRPRGEVELVLGLNGRGRES